MKVLYVIFLALAMWKDVADGRKCPFQKTANSALYGHNTYTLSSVSVRKCMIVCNGLDYCKSFDYRRGKRSCFLNDENMSTAPTSFGKHSQMDYYEKIEFNGYCDESGEDNEDNYDYSGSGNGDDGHKIMKRGTLSTGFHWVDGEYIFVDEDNNLPTGFYWIDGEYVFIE